MSPRSIGQLSIRETPVLQADDRLGDAVRRLADSGLPALPVAGADGRLLGIFGEREFITAVFPGYLGELRSARFVHKVTDRALELRAEAADEPVSKHIHREHVDVRPDFSDADLAETFLHHRVLVIPVVEDGRCVGVITRADFFRALVDRFERDG